MLYSLSPEDMRSLEAGFMRESGCPGILLMEHAAQGLAGRIFHWMRKREGSVLFLCGPGNNGGDGFAAARLYVNGGGRARVWRLPGELSGEAELNLRLLKSLYPQTPVTLMGEDIPPFPRDAALIVDALFGTGLCRPLEGVAMKLVGQVNGCGLPVIAADIPSGLSGRTGRAMGDAVRAWETVTFHQPKNGLYLHDGMNYTGKVTVMDIGLPLQGKGAEGWEIALPKDLKSLLPDRRPVSHKGTYGRVLVLAGSPGMAGAAAVCAQAALKAGAGLCTVAAPQEIIPIVQALAPCATCIALPFQENAFLPEAAQILAKAASLMDSLAVGPGLGTGPDRVPLLRAAKEAGKPAVWDADALNLMACHPELIRLNGRCVITPHPGEAARLLDTGTAQIAADGPAALDRLHDRSGAVAVLKGAATLITDGRRRAINITGTPAMAKGGSGDALTGVTAALLCRLPAFEAAQAACLIHGMAGVAAAKKTGENALTAFELIQALP